MAVEVQGGDTDVRPLTENDFRRLVDWQAQPHIARWYGEPPDLATIEARYGLYVAGETSATEVFVVELATRAIGLIQRYLIRDHPKWAATIGVPDDAGIDYYLGELDMVGRGFGTAMIAAFTTGVFERYPDTSAVVVAPQQANVASWRALEKAGYARVGAGQLDSDDPTDSGPGIHLPPDAVGSARAQRPGMTATVYTE
jgi:aminoglycoside 6'-N-acetyltransferase